MNLKKVILICISILLGIQQFGYGQSSILEGNTIKSKILGENVKYSIYLPDGYNTSTRLYPVVFLLHGYTGNQADWAEPGEIGRIADNAIKQGEIAPVILVMPDAKNTYYVNNFNNSVRFEDMFFQEFIPAIDSMYRTRAKREWRAVAGLSMGGYGALVYAMHHPDVFSACVGLSAAVRKDEDLAKVKEDTSVWGRTIKGIYGESLVNEHWHANNPLDLVEKFDKADRQIPKFYIDCGDDDELLKGNIWLNFKMNQLGIPHEFRVRNGGHSWNYWRTGISDGLKFINSVYHPF